MIQSLHYKKLEALSQQRNLTHLSTVNEITKKLQIYYHIHKSLVLTLAAWIIRFKDFEVKLTMAKHLYFHANIAQTLKLRLYELRYNLNHLENFPLNIKSYFEELINSATDIDFLHSLVNCLLPKLRQEYADFSATTSNLADEPTLYYLKHIILDLDMLLAEGSKLCSAYAPYQENSSLTYLNIFSVNTEYDNNYQLEYVRNKECVRDERFSTFSHTRDYAKADNFSTAITDPVKKTLFEMIRTQRDEIDAIETFANVLYDLNYKIDFSLLLYLARNIWDESRHALIGQQLLNEFGYDPFEVSCGTIGIDIRSKLPPEIALAQINIFGESNIVAEILNQSRIAKANGYDLISQALDFIHADEVMHIRQGRQQLKKLFAKNSFEEVKAFARNASLEQLAKCGIKDVDYISNLSDQQISELIGE